MPIKDNDDDRYDINEGVITLSYKEEKASASIDDPFAIEGKFAKQLSGVDSNRKRKITTMQKRYEGKDGVGTKRIEDDIITGYNAFEVVLPPHNLDSLAKLVEKSAPHYAAIQAKVANIVGLGYDLVPSPTAESKLDDMDDPDQANKYRRKLQKTKNQIMQDIDDMNQEDTFAETLAKVWKDYEATGNGYLEIGRSATTGEIAYIGHIPCVTIRVRRARDGFVQIIANKAVFFRNFGDDDPNPIGPDTNPNEIIHFKKYASSSTYYGVPDIIAAQQAVAGNEFAARFNLDYFENKAVPRHVVILKGATIAPKLAQNILEFFETGLKGKNHRALFVPLPGDVEGKKVELKIEPVEAGIQDSSFNNYRKANLGEILMAHRVPISKVGLAEGVSLAVAKDADKTFKEQVCQPEQRIAEKKLNRIFKEITDLLLLKLNELSLTDENTQSQIDERRRKTGTETANEQRARRGMPGVEGGDEVFDMNAATKLAELADKTTRRGQDLNVKTAQASGPVASAGANANGNPVGTRQRDTQRSANATDSADGGRNPKGEGRTNLSG